MVDWKPVDRILNRARSVTRARMVAVSRYDRETGLGSVVAMSGPQSRAFLQAVETAKRFSPGFDPVGFNFHVSANEHSHAVYLEGRVVAVPLEELAKGMVSPQLIRIAVHLGGLKHTLVCPLAVGGRVLGSVTFYASRPLGPRRPEFEKFVGDELMTWEDGLLPRLLRSAGSSAAAIPKTGGDVIALAAQRSKKVWRFANLTVDVPAGTAFLGTSPLGLTEFEFALLVCLIQRQRQIVTLQELARRVATTPDTLGQRLVELTVHHLRRKLEHGGSARLIHSIRGVGYTLREDEPGQATDMSAS